jgi:small subunit ribosomal protein S13
MRILGVTIPDDKTISYALTEVYGIGLSRSRAILKQVGVDFDTKTKDLTDDQEAAIRKATEEFTLEGDLKRTVSLNIKRLKDIRAYRGLRHMVGLPVRGQRTKTNARTRKGPVKTMGSGRTKLTKT